MNGLRSKVALAVLICMVAGCDKNATDHPRYGKIASLTTDWTDRGEGIDIPDGYTVSIDEYKVSLSGAVNSVDHLFEPGRYDLYVYNPAAGTTVNGGIAAANYMAGELGWLFTGLESVSLDKDRDYLMTVIMRQQVRQLNLELNISGDAADRLAGIDAALSGAAGAWNIAMRQPVAGSGATARFFFTQTEGKWLATVRLLGIVGSAQELSLTLRFTDSNPASYTLISNLSGRLAAFNDNKTVPMALSAIMAVTPTQGGFTTTISNWVDGGTSTGVAE